MHPAGVTREAKLLCHQTSGSLLPLSPGPTSDANNDPLALNWLLCDLVQINQTHPPGRYDFEREVQVWEQRFGWETVGNMSV